MSALSSNSRIIQSKLTADDKVKYRLFQQSMGPNPIKDVIWAGFELILDSIHVQLICKFQNDVIKTE